MASSYNATLPARISDIQSLTFTERVGVTTRWGRYLTSLERQSVSEALRNFSAPSNALEVGCQGGRWSEMLAGKGWRVTCTEVDESVLRGCQARIPTAASSGRKPLGCFRCAQGETGLALHAVVTPEKSALRNGDLGVSPAYLHQLCK